ncbi:MAG: ECF transporter S component, partial [Parasporobacterium sp.]|nr:ECF transporter S component [Parasporobacterium sp.]
MKKKLTVLNLCLCAAMIALHIVLELFLTIRIGDSLKITLATLPFVIIGLLCGPIEGFVTGLLGTFLSQLLTFGITLSTPFWILPGALLGLSAGLIYKAFKRRTKLVPIGVTVFASMFILVLFNWIASYMDGVVLFKYWTPEIVIALIPARLLVWGILSVVYT